MQVNRILCPTDLSPNSASGLLYASSLARKSAAELIVMHVAQFPPMPFYAMAECDGWPSRRQVYLPPTVDRILQTAEARLQSFIRSHVDGPYRARVSLGKPAREIVRAALEEQAEMIVMARRRLGFLRRMISPSISEEVSRKAPCPVLSMCPAKIQRPPASGPRPTIAGWFAGAEA